MKSRPNYGAVLNRRSLPHARKKSDRWTIADDIEIMVTRLDYLPDVSREMGRTYYSTAKRRSTLLKS